VQPLTVFLDEGALDGDARLPSACAVIVGDVASATEQIENLIHELTLQPAFRLEPGAARFGEVGFHHVEDNFLAKERFKGLLPRMDFEWWCSANLDTQADDPYANLPDQFRWVTGRILQKYRGRRVHFVFEQNDRLRTHFPSIVESAVTTAGISADLVTFSIGTKLDRVLSVADYCIALASQATKVWMETCCDTHTLHRKHPYRSFAEIEPLCSTLFAANFRKSISNRATRLADHSFFEVAGFHSASCRQADGS
jgi:hypothetical protein